MKSKNRKIKILGITLARSGSKRIKNKNIKLLNGKPLIYYTIKEALKSKKINRYIVSTESENIKSIAKDYGAEVPFLRPKKLATDSTKDQPVIIDILKRLRKNEGYTPDVVVNLRPTSPLRTKYLIDKAINLFLQSKSGYLRSVSKVEGTNHPYWMFTINKNGYAKNLIKKINLKKFYRSQELPPVYKINGMIDIYNYDIILNKDILLEKMSTFVVSEKIAIDIDTKSEFQYCEYLLNK